MDRRHFKCLLWKGLWGLSVIALVSAWVATRSGEVWGLDAQYLFWDALLFGILAIPIKLDCHSCNVCRIGA